MPRNGVFEACCAKVAHIWSIFSEITIYDWYHITFFKK